MPSSALFPEVGTAIFRSGFSTDDFTFTFRSGPFYNHQHFDQGSFFLSDRGEELIVEVGRSHYYDDPWYQPSVIQAGGHSTILLDDNPESRKAGDLLADGPAWQDRATITDFLTWEGGGFVSGRLERIYKGAADFLSRSAVWVAPRTIVLIDRGVGAHDAETMNLRFHAPRKRDLQVALREARITRPNATLRIRTVAPQAGVWALRSRPMTLAEFDEQEPATMTARGFVQFDIPLGNEPTTLVHVLSTDTTMLNRLAEERAADHVEVMLDGNRYLINTSVDGEMTDGRIRTDAVAFAGTPQRRLVLQATRVIEDARAVLTAAAPVSLTLERDGPGRTIGFSTREPTTVTIHLETAPSRVSLNDAPMNGWTRRPVADSTHGTVHDSRSLARRSSSVALDGGR